SRRQAMDHFHAVLRSWQDCDFIGDIRYLGFIGAVDIVKSRSQRLPFPPADRIGFHIYLESLQNNLLLRPLDNTIYWFLPLVVTVEDIDLILAKSLHTIQTVVARQAAAC
ncbi:adenosylmethionine--8-amino-7-oxononanoate transaminase, partial [candidate division FCPU426 bacterium]|nr:adenosylmethionine--8-amino-7-oxononanoate transaminase [candidate division FCPU426 bacterium]